MNVCPHTVTKTTNSRPWNHRNALRVNFEHIVYRRRECLKCKARFSTWELTGDQIEKLEDGLIRTESRLKQTLTTIQGIIERTLK